MKSDVSVNFTSKKKSSTPIFTFGLLCIVTVVQLTVSTFFAMYHFCSHIFYAPD